MMLNICVAASKYICVSLSLSLSQTQKKNGRVIVAAVVQSKLDLKSCQPSYLRKSRLEWVKVPLIIIHDSTIWRDLDGMNADLEKIHSFYALHP